MKKYILKYLAISVIFMGFLSSCEKKFETADLSALTYYPEFTYNGEEVILIEAGTTFVEPGVTAMENGVDIPVSILTAGIFSGYFGETVVVDTPDKYGITYSSVNSDGYTGTQERTVWVAETGDLTSSLAGLYTSQITRDPGYTTDPGLSYVLIWEEGGVFYISDVIGGWYDLEYGYGTGYAGQGMSITVNDMATNDFTFGDAIGVGAFGGSCSMDEMTVDAVAGTINFVSSWSFGYVFDVTLTQVSI